MKYEKEKMNLKRQKISEFYLKLAKIFLENINK